MYYISPYGSALTEKKVLFALPLSELWFKPVLFCKFDLIEGLNRSKDSQVKSDLS